VNFVTDFKRARAYFTLFLRGNLKEGPATRRGKRHCGTVFCSSTSEIGSSSSPELCLGKQDPCWVYMLHHTEICLIVNAWCSMSHRSFFSPDLICSLSMWDLPQLLTRSTWFAPADYGVSHWCGVPSTGHWGLGWGRRPFIAINLGLWSRVLSQNCIFLCFLMWI